MLPMVITLFQYMTRCVSNLVVLALVFRLYSTYYCSVLAVTESGANSINH